MNKAIITAGHHNNDSGAVVKEREVDKVTLFTEKETTTTTTRDGTKIQVTAKKEDLKPGVTSFEILLASRSKLFSIHLIKH